jgi:hypothetical protein
MATRHKICSKWFCITSLGGQRRFGQRVPDDTELVKVPAAALSAKGLLEHDLHRGNVVAVPDRSKDTICKSEIISS